MCLHICLCVLNTLNFIGKETCIALPLLMSQHEVALMLKISAYNSKCANLRARIMQDWNTIYYLD